MVIISSRFKRTHILCSIIRMITVRLLCYIIMSYYTPPPYRHGIHKERVKGVVPIPLRCRDIKGLIAEWCTATVTSASIKIAAQDTHQVEKDTQSSSYNYTYYHISIHHDFIPQLLLTWNKGILTIMRRLINPSCELDGGSYIIMKCCMIIPKRVVYYRTLHIS